MAQIVAGDDPRERLRWLGRPVNDTLLLLVGTEQVAIRIDLSDNAAQAQALPSARHD